MLRLLGKVALSHVREAVISSWMPCRGGSEPLADFIR